MPTKLLIRIERLESAAADQAANEPTEPLFSPEERARRITAMLYKFLREGVLVKMSDGTIAAGNLPDPGNTRSLACFILALHLTLEDGEPGDQVENVKICEVDHGN